MFVSETDHRQQILVDKTSPVSMNINLYGVVSLLGRRHTSSQVRYVIVTRNQLYHPSNLHNIISDESHLRFLDYGLLTA